MAIHDHCGTSLAAYPKILGLAVGATLINGSFQTTVDLELFENLCRIYYINEHKDLCNVYGSMIFSL